MWNEAKSKYRELKEGRRIWLLSAVKNNDLTIPKQALGKIVYNQNQVEADIWYYDNENLKSLLNLDGHPMNNNAFGGIVLKTAAKDFALIYNEKHDNGIMFYADKLSNIPFLTLEGLRTTQGLRYTNNERDTQYNIEDLLERIEGNFTEWVNQLESYEEECDEHGIMNIFTSESRVEFDKQQQEINESFAMATGIYYEFKGGTMEY